MQEEGLTTVQQDLRLNVSLSHRLNHHPLPLGIVNLSPPLLPHKRITSQQLAGEVAKTAGDNIGLFFVDLYSQLHRKDYEFMPERTFNILDGEVRKFRPDLIQDTLFGEKHIEIKASSLNRSQSACGINQVENYVYQLLKQAISGEKQRPVFRYAIFRYGDSHENLRLHNLNRLQAGRKLARNIKDCTVLSTNQVMALLSLSRSETRAKQAESDSGKYFILSGAALTLLQDPKCADPSFFLKGYKQIVESKLTQQRRKLPSYQVDAIRERFERARRYCRRETLGLDDLVVEQFQSNDRARFAFGGVELPSFPVTVYSIKDYPAWLKGFKKHHKSLLKPLGIRNLYAEQKAYEERNEPPF